MNLSWNAVSLVGGGGVFVRNWMRQIPVCPIVDNVQKSRKETEPYLFCIRCDLELLTQSVLSLWARDELQTLWVSL